MARELDDIDFEKIDITNDLMFGSVFQNPKLCKGLIEVLLGIRVESLQYVETQERMDGAGPLSRAGVIDLLVKDVQGNEFDLEMQNKIGSDLPFRARRYLSLLDAMALKPGQNFNEARGATVVFICTHDSFGRGWKRYDYERICAQDGMPLGDRTRIVFVNAEGTRGDFGDEYDAFLKYLLNHNDVESDYVRNVDEAVRTLRDSPLWRRSLVFWSEKYRDEFNDARREGHAEGLKEGREEGLEQGREQGLAQGRDEGRAAGLEEGFAKGRSESREELLRLADKLEQAGRGAEFVPALRDPTKLSDLLKEFGIG